jgi:hypothetical protein
MSRLSEFWYPEALHTWLLIKVESKEQYFSLNHTPVPRELGYLSKSKVRSSISHLNHRLSTEGRTWIHVFGTSTSRGIIIAIIISVKI